MPSQKNQQLITELKDKVAQAKSVVVFGYAGTTANEQVALRAQVKEVGAEVIVTKNTLLDIAIGKDKLSESLKGMNAFLFSYDDAAVAIKKLFEFKKKNDAVTIKQGFMDDAVLTPAQVEALSKLPSKKELLSTLINRIQGPAYGLVNVLKAGQRDFVNVLRAVSKKEA